MIHLNDHDLAMIEKRFQIQANRGKKKVPTFNVSFDICQGDVVQYKASKTLIYVHFADNSKIIGYPISFQFAKHWVKIKINRKNFYIDFNNQIIISDINQLKLVDIANAGEIGVIEQKKREGLERSKKRRINYKLGTVFKTDIGKMMYLYDSGGSQYGVNLDAYKIIPAIKEIPNIANCEQLEVFDCDKILGVVKFLYSNLAQPNQKLNNIYRDMI